MIKQPAYGAGLAYRRMFHSDIMRCQNDIDFLEMPTIDYLERHRRIAADPNGHCMAEVRKTFTCVGHGIDLSIGTVDEPEKALLEKTKSFLHDNQITEFSDHLTFHRMADKDLSVFMSMPFDHASARWVANQYHASKKILGQPFGLEIVTYPFKVPGSELSEVEFVNMVAEQTDCWLLLDVANLFYNSTNHGYDPIDFLDQLNGERVQHLHVAGGHQDGDQWIDSHNQPVHEEVFELLDEVLKRTSARAVILERDEEPDHFGSIIDDLARTREIFERRRPAVIPADLLEGGPPVFERSIEGPCYDLDNLPDDIEGLRLYQQGLVDCSFALADGNLHNRSPGQILGDYRMSPDWQARWQEMDWAVFQKLGAQVHGVQEFEKKAAEFSRMAELAQFASRQRGFA